MTDALERALPGVAVLLLFAPTGDAAAQVVDVGGRAFIDYYYRLSSPDESQEGLHGFTYRRLYLTADAAWSEAFSARARLEANDGTMGPRGPVPIVKDLWVEWRYHGPHSTTLGVMPTPAFELAEDVYGYRSLEKTVLDFQDITASRDFGIRVDGPLTSGGTFRYALMLANNSTVRPETDVYKRGYARLSFHPSEMLTFSVGGDRAGYGDERRLGQRLSAFGGYVTDAASIGAQIYSYVLEFVDEDALRHVGVSLFGSFRLNPHWELMARTDVARERLDGADVDEAFLLAGVAYSPIDNIRIIPNLWLFDSEASRDEESLGRITVEVSF